MLLLRNRSALMVPCSTLCVHRRHAIMEHRTKNMPYMKHLDIYARRDPQLAPYLLREVDIEYKRQGRKVTFVLWVALCTVVTAVHLRIQSEELHYMKLYITQMKAEQDAKDRDNTKRREVFAKLMNVISDAFRRDQAWHDSDAHRAADILR